MLFLLVISVVADTPGSLLIGRCCCLTATQRNIHRGTRACPVLFNTICEGFCINALPLLKQQTYDLLLCRRRELIIETIAYANCSRVQARCKPRDVWGLCIEDSRKDGGPGHKDSWKPYLDFS